MSDVKWIKLTVDMFDNRKIKHLRRLPDGNSIVLIWVMLLTMAGRCNASGMIFLTENIPYSAKMLADELGFDESVVRLALTTFEQLGMISADEYGFLAIPGWEEYQNIDGLEKIRESKRLAQARWREKQKQLEISTVDSTVDSTRAYVDDADIDKERDKEKETDIEEESISRTPPRAERHIRGAYGWVKLTDAELEKMRSEWGDAETARCIDYVDESAQRTGNKNKWKDWNLVVRKCHREQWGVKQNRTAQMLSDSADMIGRWANG